MIGTNLAITPKRFVPLGGAATDADAQAFITAAGITDTTQQSAVNQLVLDLKSANIWTKMKAIYPIVGGSATTHKWNLKDPRDLDAAYRLTFATGWTHGSTGMTPNGATYANTFLVPSSAITLNSVHISYYSRTNITPAASTDIGSWTNTSINYTLLALGTTLGSYAGLQQTSFSDYPVFTDADSRGFYMATRTSSSLSSIYKNGLLKDTSAQASTGNGTNSFYIGSGNGNNPNYSSKQCAFASIGDGLTDTEASLLYQITEKYQVTLGRNINTTQSFYYNGSYDNDTNVFLFNTQITDTTQQTAVNTLVTDLKSANIWTKMKAIYPIVGGTASSHKWNLKDPRDLDAAFRLNFSTGWTHASTGMTSNGTSAYADTFFNPLSQSIGLNEGSFGIYSRTSRTASGSRQHGIVDYASPLTFTLIIPFSAGNLNQSSMHSSTQTSIATTNSQGFYQTSRTSSTNINVSKNSTVTASSINSVRIPNGNYWLGARNEVNGTTEKCWDNLELAFAYLGKESLSSNDLQNYNTAVQNYQTTLARNV